MLESDETASKTLDSNASCISGERVNDTKSEHGRRSKGRRAVRARLIAEGAPLIDPQPVAPRRRENFNQLMAFRIAADRAAYKGFSGRFADRADLLTFLNAEIQRDERSLVAIMRDARIQQSLFWYLMRSGQLSRRSKNAGQHKK